MPETPKKPTLRDVQRMIFRHKFLFLLGASAAALTVLIAAWWYPLKYTGTARLERRMDAAAEEINRTKSESAEGLRLTMQNELAGLMALQVAVDDLEMPRRVAVPAQSPGAKVEPDAPAPGKTGPASPAQSEPDGDRTSSTMQDRPRLVGPFPRGLDGRLTPDGMVMRQKLVEDLKADLKVEFEVKSDLVDLVSVKFSSHDPRLAKELPNTLVTNYINRKYEEIIRRLTDSRDFLQKKVTEADNRFIELTNKRITFETRYAGMQPNSPDALAQELQKISSDMDTVRRQQFVAQQKVDRIKALMDTARRPLTAAEKPKEPPAETKGDGKTPEAKAEGKPASPADPSPELALRAAYTELSRRQEQLLQYKSSLEEAKTLGHMTDKHPRVVALRKQIADTENQVADARNRVVELEARVKELAGRAVTPPTSFDTSGRDAILEEARQRDNELRGTLLSMDLAAAQSEVDSTTNELARLQKRKDDVDKLLNQFGPIRQEYLGIVKDIMDQQAEVDRWQRRLNDVQMALVGEAAKRRTHLTQVELAQEQFVPSSPKLLYVLAFALLGGLAFGSGLVFTANMMDRSFTTSEEVAQHVDLPVYAVVSEIVTPRERANRRLRAWILGPTVSLAATLAIAAAALNIALWLQYREQYKEWSSSPLSFVWREAGERLGDLKNRL